MKDPRGAYLALVAFILVMGIAMSKPNTRYYAVPTHAPISQNQVGRRMGCVSAFFVTLSFTNTLPVSWKARPLCSPPQKHRPV